MLRGQQTSSVEWFAWREGCVLVYDGCHLLQAIEHELRVLVDYYLRNSQFCYFNISLKEANSK